MKLTGKTKEAFLKWFKKSEKIKLHEYEKVEIVFKIQNESYKNALIIEFFDSVGIYVSIHYETFGNHYFNVMVTRNHLTTNLRTDASTRIEATNEAIIKANDLYNGN